MEQIDSWIGSIAAALWGLPLIVVAIGSGVLLLFYSRGKTLCHLGDSVRIVFERKKTRLEDGTLTPYQALSTSLSGTVGLGNIAGVSWAVVVGGPGAVFWMWVVGVLGTVVRFFTCTLAVQYRERSKSGQVVGGPMYVVKNGLHRRWQFLAAVFSVGVAAASLGGGNMFQTNQVATSLFHYFQVPRLATGISLSLLTALVIVGGVKRIGDVASVLTPIMCGFYLVGGLVVIGQHIGALPAVIGLIVRDAFSGIAVAGGSLGLVISQGVRRAVFSSEMGLGSAAIAHATAKTNSPVKQGIVAMLDPIVDTLVICTITALVVLLSGVCGHSQVLSAIADNADLRGIVVVTEAFNLNLPGFGKYVVGVGVVLFAFSSGLAWAYYGEAGVRYFSDRPLTWSLFRAVFLVAMVLGAVWKFEVVLNLSDILFATMIVPTMLSALLLAPQCLRLLQKYDASRSHDSLQR